MDGLVWCPYTDKDLPLDSCSPEHIVPLSLGGCNEFTIPVAKEANSTVGSEIDGGIANDFFINLARSRLNMRGHNGSKRPKATRRAKFGNKPVQIEFTGGAPKVWDAIERRVLGENEFAGQSMSFEVRHEWFTKARFVAKVALSGGAYVYGRSLRETVDHNELRKLIINNPPHGHLLQSSRCKFTDSLLQIEAPPERINIIRTIIETLDDAAIILFTPYHDALGITVGILGNFIGDLQVPAKTDTFPLTGDYDLGHFVIIQNRKLTRMSFRSFLQNLLSDIEGIHQGH
ncbi:MAG TPA: hypothetical protein VGE29_17485 [Prosthecobacter sp.]